MKKLSTVVVLGVLASVAAACSAPVGSAPSRALQADGTGALTIRELTIGGCFTDLVVDRFESPDGSQFSARLNLVPTGDDGVYTAVSNQAALANELFVVKGRFDQNDGSFELRDAFSASDDAATVFTWDGEGNGSLTEGGEAHTLTGCTTSVKATTIDPGQVKDTTLVKATDGDATATLVRREYNGVTRICYERDPSWDLVRVMPTADQLPNLVAAAALDLAKGDDSAIRAARTASGARFPIDKIIDFQYATGIASAYPVLQGISLRNSFGSVIALEVSRCDYASIPDNFQPPPPPPPVLPGAGPQ
jgi:hypothetical protein